jgi:hypothetical protein
MECLVHRVNSEFTFTNKVDIKNKSRAVMKIRHGTCIFVVYSNKALFYESHIKTIPHCNRSIGCCMHLSWGAAISRK